MTLCADAELSKLCQEFPDFDQGLIEGMLADQGGDSAEVHACLRVRPQRSLFIINAAKRILPVARHTVHIDWSLFPAK